jgi:hypothetical protein
MPARFFHGLEPGCAGQSGRTEKNAKKYSKNCPLALVPNVIDKNQFSIFSTLTHLIMSEFLLLFRGGDGRQNPQTPEQAQAHMQRWWEWMGALSEQDRMLGGEPLNRGGKTIAGTQMLMTDGPYLEGKEMVGGYLMLKAESLDEATEIAKGCPILEFEDGTVEVRPINKLEM